MTHPGDRPVPDTVPDLRRAGDRDVEAIRDLVATAYVGYTPLIGRTPIPMLTDHAVAVRDHDVWVLEADGTIVGVLELDARADHLWIDNVAIAPPWQGRGLGRRLLRQAEDEARRQGLGEIGLLTNERYLDNIAMYVRHGYRETHRERHLGTDLVFFRKVMTPSTERARFVPDGFRPPLGLDHPSFRLRPLAPEHNDSDYAAWTSSMDHIHRTPGFVPDGWPRQMTLEENRGDLERHAADFAAGDGFTYTVLAPDRDEVIGCVYIYPMTEGEGATVRSWVRERDAPLDAAVFRAVSDWLARDWPLQRVEYDARS